mgnify:FL=1|jgi:hypothetical protein
MYMSDMLDLDFDNDFVFMNNKNGDLTGAGFTIHSDLLKDTLYGGSSHDTQRGGASILSTLKDLAVPAGLFYTQKKIQKNHLIKYENNPEIIEESVYDSLLSLLDPSSQPKHSIKTRRKRENKRKMSRKRK